MYEVPFGLLAKQCLAKECYLSTPLLTLTSLTSLTSVRSTKTEGFVRMSVMLKGSVACASLTFQRNVRVSGVGTRSKLLTLRAKHQTEGYASFNILTFLWNVSEALQIFDLSVRLTKAEHNKPLVCQSPHNIKCYLLRTDIPNIRTNVRSSDLH